MGLFDGFVGAALGFAGGLLGNSSSAKEAKESRNTSIYASKHQHRWEVADLKAAGLNPILSANSGASLSSLPIAQQLNPASGIGDTLNTADKINNVDKKIAKSTIDLQSQSALNQEKQAGKAVADQHLAETNEILSAENAKNAVAQREVIRRNAELVDAQVQREFSQSGMNSALAVKALQEAGVAEKQKALLDYDISAREYGKAAEKYTAPIDKVLDTVGKGADVISPRRLIRGGKK